MKIEHLAQDGYLTNVTITEYSEGGVYIILQQHQDRVYIDKSKIDEFIKLLKKVSEEKE